MNRSSPLLSGVLVWLLCAVPATSAVRYVNISSHNPTPPATAATVIQDAIDVADAGDEIVVTDGVYETGGRAVVGPGEPALVNRVAVTKPLTVRSVNGPGVTVIRGHQVLDSNGEGAVRCVYLASSASLAGFTVTNGGTWSDYPYYSSALSTGGGVFCESAKAVVSNCVLTGNLAAGAGSAAYGGTLNNCTLTGNATSGARECMLNNCTLSANSGNGAIGGTLNNCTLSGNKGRGARGAILNNCTITGNSSGGVSVDSLPSILNNCILYYNKGGNYSGSDVILNYCCTTPLPTNGVGNITAEPQLASASHISATSPCRGAGGPASTSGRDIDGEPWSGPPSIGCDEVYSGNETGPLTVAIQADFTHVTVGFPVYLTAEIVGNVSASEWDFGDGTVLRNRPYETHVWAVPGDYPVVLRAYNQNHPDGVSATVTVRVGGQKTVTYVAANSSNPVPPYDSWATAANTIQDAVDAAAAGALVLVNDGVYQTGGRVVSGALMNRVAVTRPLTVRSVNGPGVTVIRGHQVPGTTNGDGAVRCVYLGNGARLSGFTLTNGATAQFRWHWVWFRDQRGGGVFCESATGVVSNCVIKDNSAEECGGGACGGTLNNCTLTGNSAQYGGGAHDGTLSNCTLNGNSAQYGGGASGGMLTNCTLSGNSGDGAYDCTLNNCTLSGNSGNGAYYCGLINCTLSGNLADGALRCALNNCTLSGNKGWGARGAILNNCTITGNSSGGVSVVGPECDFCSETPSILNNCILYYNKGANYAGSDILNYCCTTPLPPGIGNITNAPLFVDAAAGNFRLQPNSPCINAGLNANAPASPDLDGNPRIVGVRVDIGAYEFQLPPPLSYAGWATGFGLSGAAAGAGADADGDGLPNSVEYILGSSPSASGASGSPTVTLSGGNMIFTFSRDDASEAPGAVLAVETSADLVTWPAVLSIGPNAAASTPGVSITENGTTPDTVSVTIPQGKAARRFARLKVTISP